MHKNVVVGSGISGLLACLYLLDKGFKDILLLEQSEALGGALKAFNYDENGIFDQGMHNILLTGNDKIDRLLLPFLNEDSWSVLDGNKRDLAGIFWKGKLQTESPYPNVFKIADKEIAAGLRDFFSVLANENSDYISSEDYFKKRFGNSFASSIFNPIVEKIFNFSSAELHYSAASIVPLSRVSFDDNSFGEILLENSHLRAKVAYPQQRNLPLEFSSGRKAYYPKTCGMYRLVDSICTHLLRNGCEILSSAKVLEMKVANRGIETVYYQKEGQSHEVNVSSLTWSAGQIQLLKTLNQNINFPFQRAQKTYVANLILRNQPQMLDLYYIYVYDPQYSTFRITNYKSYCTDCERMGGVPVSVEILTDKAMSSAEVVELAMNELEEMSLVPRKDFIWGKGEALLEGGFPLPSITNVSSLNQIRALICSLSLDNLINIGIQSSYNTFFQTDVIIDAFNKMESRWG